MHTINRLLAAASSDDLAVLEPDLEQIHLPGRRVLEAPNRAVEYVYFPETLVASAVALNGPDQRIEVGLIGCEGMSGVAVVLGGMRAPQSVYVQIPGSALRVRTDRLCEILRLRPSFHALLLKFAQVFIIQGAQTAVANGRAKLPVRLARWILMAHDRTVSDDVPLTHEFLSVMLGVRRASVTVAMHEFERRGLVCVRRGELTVIDRKAMEKLAGSFYGVPEAEYKKTYRLARFILDGSNPNPFFVSRRIWAARMKAGDDGLLCAIRYEMKLL